MNNFRFLVSAVALCISLTVVAQQKGNFAAGLNLLPGLYPNNGIGIGIAPNVLYNVTDQIRFAGELGFSIGKQDIELTTMTVSINDFSVYGHYLISQETWAFYPLVGFGMFRTKGEATELGVTVSHSEKSSVFTLGAGIDGFFQKTPNLMFRVEFRLKIHGDTHLIVAPGLTYRF